MCTASLSPVGARLISCFPCSHFEVRAGQAGMRRVAARETWVPPACAIYQLFGTWFLSLSIIGNLKQPTQNGAPPPSAPSILKKNSTAAIPSRTHPEARELWKPNRRTHGGVGAGNVSLSPPFPNQLEIAFLCLDSSNFPGKIFAQTG
jgi:hypothetical protein